MTQNRPKPKVPVLIVAAIAGIFTVNTLVMMVGPLLVDIASDLKVGVALAGQLMAFMAVPWLIAAVISGPISDVYGRKPVLLIGLAGGIIGALGMAFSWNFASAAMFRSLSGLAGVVPTNVTAVVSDYVPAERRGKAIGAITFGAGLGGVLGVPLMTLLSAATSWRWGFVAAAISVTVVWLLILWVLPARTARRHARVNVFSQLRPLLKQRVVWDLTIINTFQRTGLIVLVTYFAPYLIIKHGFSTGQTALPMAIVSSGMILASIIGGTLADTRYRLLVSPLGLGLSAALGMAIFSLNIHPAAEITMGLLYTTSIFFLFPIIATLFATIGGDKFRGTAIGMLPISNQTGSILGPALGGLALSLGGYEAIGLVCMVVGVLGASLSALLLRERRVRQAAEALASSE